MPRRKGVSAVFVAWDPLVGMPYPRWKFNGRMGFGIGIEELYGQRRFGTMWP